jgi:4'-phosphopantetheinyl transferase
MPVPGREELNAIASGTHPLAPPRSALPAGEVHVWCAAAVLAADHHRRLGATLAPAERDRAARFMFDRDRDRYIAAHGALRAVLAGYLGREPAALAFDQGRWGKPALTGGAASAGVRFNLSHAGRLALVAVARDREVGVDVERLRGDVNALEIADRYFAPEEARLLRALPSAERVATFHRFWTGKEALGKAVGKGIVAGLATPMPPAAWEGIPLQDDAGGWWRLWSLPVGAGYAAAVVVEGTAACRVRLLRLA